METKPTVTTLKYPPIVYKYRGWADVNHRNVLVKNQLYFPAPKEFNDPFDCKIPIDLSLLDSSEKIKDFIELKRLNLIANQNCKVGEMENALQDFERRLLNEMPRVQEEFNQFHFDGEDIYVGVLSLSERWDSILMWSHYADCHRGYCIGFYEEKLRLHIEGSGGPVMYSTDSEYPRLHPMEDFEINDWKKIFTKAIDWRYEEEYRITKTFYPAMPEGIVPAPPTVAERVQPFETNFISEVIIGIAATEETKRAIKEICSKKNVPVYQARKVPFMFKIDREEI